MNTLSWLLYVADAFESLGILLGITATIGVVLVLFTAIITAFHDVNNYDGPNRGASRLKMLWIPVLAGLIACAIPSSNTIYMIAASEAGSAVVNSPDGREMLDGVKAIIKKKIAEEIGK